jgi:hypothetical protein
MSCPRSFPSLFAACDTCELSGISALLVRGDEHRRQNKRQTTAYKTERTTIMWCTVTITYGPTAYTQNYKRQMGAMTMALRRR